jgi:sugar phosphate isomerase/epimerase
MKIGLLTTRFDPKDWPLDRIIDWAGRNGIDCLEIAVPRHLDAARLLKEGSQAALKDKLRRAGVAISSLAYYSMKINDVDPAVRGEQVAGLQATIEAAESLGVDTVCTLAGSQAPGKSKTQTIREDLPGVFGPLLEQAQRRGVRLALENYFRTNIQHLDHWRAMFEALPQKNFGLNYDPSHLLWQGIDYMAAVEEFAGRIFHTHAKDVAIDEAALRRLGVLEGGWWRYTIPGTGRVDWGQYLGKLREIGFAGAVSIEHEDKTLSAEAGFAMAARYLRTLIG